MAISVASRKAKGRRLQQEVRDNLREIGVDYGLVAEDIESTGMGQAGVDVLLSPAARKIFPLSIECKNHESLNVLATFIKHHTKYEKNSDHKLLIHKKNHSPILVTLRWDDLLSLYKENLRLKNLINDN